MQPYQTKVMTGAVQPQKSSAWIVVINGTRIPEEFARELTAAEVKELFPQATAVYKIVAGLVR